MAEAQTNTTTPPYISFRTFLNLVIKMEDGAPRRLDRSYLAGQAGGLHQPIIAAFRYFDLIGPDNEVNAALNDLAAAGDDRPAMVRKLIEDHYSWALLNEPNATQQMLDEAFKTEADLSGSTLRKAVTFFLHAAAYAGMKLSPHYKSSRGVSGGRTGPRRATTTRKKQRAADPPPPPPPATPAKPTNETEMKVAYFAMLLEKASKGEKIDEELADRMERVIGLGSTPSRRRGGKSGVRVIKAGPGAVPRFTRDGNGDDNGTEAATDVDPDDETFEPTQEVP